MAIFGPKPRVNPFGKISIFRLLELVVFIAQTGVFSFQNIVEHISSDLYCLKKKSWKSGHFFYQNHGLTPFEKCQFLDFLNLMFLQLERRFFVVECRKTHFPGLYCLKKKIVKMAIFGPKPLVNPFGKISIFPLFKHVDFIAQKGVFSFQNIVKHIFLAYIA